MPDCCTPYLKPMRELSAWLAAWIAIAVLATAPALAQRPADASSWLWRDQGSGRLLDRTTPVGDRIPDFSRSGYNGNPRGWSRNAIRAPRRAGWWLITKSRIRKVRSLICARPVRKLRSDAR